MSFIYLFNDHDNGYGIDTRRTYFQSDKELTQEEVNQCIYSVFPAASRTGSRFYHFKEGAEKKGIKIEELRGQHKVDGVLRNISGNY